MELQAVVQVRHIGELAAHPVQGLANDHLECAGFQVCQELTVAVPECAAAADCPVHVVRGERPALLLDIAAADLDLILDRGLALVVARIAGVDDGAHVVILSVCGGLCPCACGSR